MAGPTKPPPEPDAAAAAPAPSGRLRLLIAAVAAVALLAAAGGGAWHFLLRPQLKAEAKEAPAKPPEHVLKIGTIVVNIAGTDGRRYLRTTLELGTKPKNAKHLEELRAPLLDAAIGILGGKTLEELLKPEERDDLRDELREGLNQAAGGHGITHVFLTEFVVQ